MAKDGLSIDVAAELASASRTETTAPTETPVESDVQTTAPEEGSLPPSDLDDDDRGSFWDNVPDSDEDQSESEEGDESETSAEVEGDEAEQGSIAPYKFKGNGQEMELDPVKDRAKIEKELSLAAGAKLAFSQKAKLQKENDQYKKEMPTLKKHSDLVRKMEAAYEDGGVEAAYEIFTGGKSMEDEIKRRVDQALAYREMSPEEQREIDRQQEQDDRARERAAYERKLQRERDEIQKERRENEIARIHSVAFPALKEAVAKLDIKDRVERQKISKMLWRQTWDNIEDLGEDAELTPEVFSREFDSAIKLLGYTRKEAARAEVKKATEEQRTVAKKKAASAVKKNYKRGTVDTKGLSGLSATQRHKKLFGT